MSDVARVLVCEDSPTYAAGLRGFLERDEDLRVVGVCESGEALPQAVSETCPDLVTMDIELPGIDGVEATRRLMARAPVAVMVLSAHTPRGSERAAAALAAGALDAMPKSDLRLDEPAAPAAVALRRRVKRLALVRMGALRSRAAADPPPKRLAARRAAVVGICASTGGPQALQSLLGELPEDFPVPILVVQHISAGFLAGLVRWLDVAVAPPVAVAQHGMPLRRGVTFAPDDAHLLLDARGRLALDRHTTAGPHRPSGDLLLRSIATRGIVAVGVVLTGMGRDGADGLAAVAGAGGLAVAQDEASSAVYGMPKAAIERGGAVSLSPTEIGGALADLTAAGVPA